MSGQTIAVDDVQSPSNHCSWPRSSVFGTPAGGVAASLHISGCFANAGLPMLSSLALQDKGHLETSHACDMIPDCHKQMGSYLQGPKHSVESCLEGEASVPRATLTATTAQRAQSEDGPNKSVNREAPRGATAPLTRPEWTGHAPGNTY